MTSTMHGSPIPQILKRSLITDSALSELTVSQSAGAYSLGSFGKTWKAREVSTLTGLAFDMSGVGKGGCVSGC
jgi:hypothetical protein